MSVNHSAAEEFLMHHGVKGQKWGVIRTPQQLGHTVAKKVPSGEKKSPKVVGTKTPGKAFRKSTSISDEELQKRINRLNMEERYDDLVARKDARNNKGFKAWAKEQTIKSLKSFGEQTLQWAVGKAVDKATGRNGKKFNIDDYKDMDVSKMDSDTIAKVSKWYGDAMKISTARSKLTPDSSSSSSSGSSSGSSSTSSSAAKPKPASSSSGTDYSKRPAWGSTPATRSHATRQQMNEWIRQRNRAISDLRR